MQAGLADWSIRHGNTNLTCASPSLEQGPHAGLKRTLKPNHLWMIGVRRELAAHHRDLALFNLAIDSKLRGCDLVSMSRTLPFILWA